MDRRGFLGSILDLGAAPAIVRADSLMRIVPRDAAFVTTYEWKQVVSDPVVVDFTAEELFQGTQWTQEQIIALLAQRINATKILIREQIEASYAKA